MAEAELNKVCGHCKNFSPMIDMMKGMCPVMPGKSFRGKKVMHDMNASECPKFDPVEGTPLDTATLMESIPMSLVSQQLIPVDAGEGDMANIRERLEKEIESTKDTVTKEDRLVWEKHAKKDKS